MFFLIFAPQVAPLSSLSLSLWSVWAHSGCSANRSSEPAVMSAGLNVWHLCYCGQMWNTISLWGALCADMCTGAQTHNVCVLLQELVRPQSRVYFSAYAIGYVCAAIFRPWYNVSGYFFMRSTVNSRKPGRDQSEISQDFHWSVQHGTGTSNKPDTITERTHTPVGEVYRVWFWDIKTWNLWSTLDPFLTWVRDIWRDRSAQGDTRHWQPTASVTLQLLRDLAKVRLSFSPTFQGSLVN